MPEHFEKPPELRTRQLVLRPLSADFAEDFFAICNDAEVMRYASTPPLSREASDTRLHDWLRDTVKGSVCCWLLCNTQNEFVGQVSLYNIDKANLRAELGYGLMPHHWGKAYASEAIAAAIRYAFDYLKLCRLEADIDPNNIASRRVLEKNGFSREGIMPKRWYKEGRFFDTWYYGLLNEKRIRELESNH